MKKTIIISASIMVSMLFFSCKKEAGKGGKSTLKGAVVATFYCGENGSIRAISGAPGERIFISYGGGTYYDDDMRTGTNGEFEFKYLNPGTYRVSILSECDTCSTGFREVSKSVEIGKKDRNVSVGELKIDLYGNRYCEGSGKGGVATAKGNLGAIFINGNNGDTLSIGQLLNQRVYLVYGEGTTSSDDVRSSSDGSYHFTELRPGKYRAFAYSDCLYCANGIEPVYVDFEVTASSTEVNIPKLEVVVIK
ncbi:MAG: hypothetical protein CL840_01535 [Crocinitomicaceae bacterium]|nr:hypothetical protein [Crocinitomicaceae bacterium]|tara:strand:- start:4218 stop:4967 length:750 start_codon:yes stop_codon:yes gene_type:complete